LKVIWSKNERANHHEELVEGFYNQLKEIFDSSKQAIYLYLDDNQKVCNKKFAEMQGFSSPEEGKS
jgi:PAS domain-containing protein